ncbi:MAG: ATPase/DNA packaging protein [bacterium]
MKTLEWQNPKFQQDISQTPSQNLNNENNYLYLNNQIASNIFGIRNEDKFFKFPRILNKWDPRRINPNSFILVMGMRGSGKTVFADWMILKNRDKWPFVYVFTKTEFNKFWKSRVPEKFVFKGFLRDKLEEIISHQKKLIGNDNKIVLGGQLYEVNPHILIILDDIISDDIWNDPILKQLAVEGRHIKICVVLNIQYIVAVTTMIRENADFVISFIQFSKRAIEYLANDFLGPVNFNEAQRGIIDNLQDNVNRKHQAVIIERNMNTERNYAEFIYICKAIDLTKNLEGELILGSIIQEELNKIMKEKEHIVGENYADDKKISKEDLEKSSFKSFTEKLKNPKLLFS